MSTGHGFLGKYIIVYWRIEGLNRGCWRESKVCSRELHPMHVCRDCVNERKAESLNRPGAEEKRGAPKNVIPGSCAMLCEAGECYLTLLSLSEPDARVSPSQRLASLELRLPFEGLRLREEMLELEPTVQSSESKFMGWNSS